MTEEEITGKIIINDGLKKISIKIYGNHERDLYDIYNFMRKMKKEPGSYTLELEIE
jgi:hypothetical protein